MSITPEQLEETAAKPESDAQTAPDASGEELVSEELVGEDLVIEDLVIEDVSIDGMCGVY